jgi:hypothetical protein
MFDESVCLILSNVTSGLPFVCRFGDATARKSKQSTEVLNLLNVRSMNGGMVDSRCVCPSVSWNSRRTSQ